MANFKFLVLIVAKCNVNSFFIDTVTIFLVVLIVAKCNVNEQL